MGKGKFLGRGDFFKILKDENDLAKWGVVRGHSWAEGKGAWCEREEAGEDLRHWSTNRGLEISLWSSDSAAKSKLQARGLGGGVDSGEGRRVDGGRGNKF